MEPMLTLSFNAALNVLRSPEPSLSSRKEPISVQDTADLQARILTKETVSTKDQRVQR